jgi:hypothetical protein
MAIGEELLDVPFAELLRSLASAIAEGQLALDRTAILTMRELVQQTIPLVPEVTEIIEPVERLVDRGDGTTIPVTGVNIRASGATPVPFNLLQAGIQPTFYQFTQADIDVKLSISLKRVEESTRESGPEAAPRSVRGEILGVQAFASSVNYRTSNTYSYSAEGSSVLRATLRPVPAPPRVVPRTVIVNTFTSPPTVTTTG